MTGLTVDEPPIDTSLAHYMETRALEIARERAQGEAQQSTVAYLAALRATLMVERQAFEQEAVARRHARGEIYSAARVAAINAMGPSRAELERNVRACYLEKSDLDGLLKSHARIHFAFNLVAQRMNLVHHTPDLLPAARAMQDKEEAFAAAWIAAIGDAAFEAELRQSQRDAVRMLRTASRPIHLVTVPASDPLDDDEAAALGKAWGKLDELAQALGTEPLSNFLAVPGEDDAAAVPIGQVLATVAMLHDAVQSPAHKLPGKRAVTAALGKMRATLARHTDDGARAYFDIDL